MAIATQELRTLNFSNEPHLRNRNGQFSVNIAAWINIDHPANISGGRLTLNYFVGTGYKSIEIDNIKIPTGASVLLSSRVRLPYEMRNIPLNLIAEVDGSNFHLDTLFVEPILDTKSTQQKPMFVA